MKTPEVLIIGAGAIGCYFGGRLAQAGAEVSVVARSDYDFVRKNGYQIHSIDGDFHFVPAGVYRSAAEYPGEADYILIAVKALPCVDLVEMVRPAMKEKTAILLIQNGIDIELALHNAFPDHCFLSAVAYIGVGRTGPGELSHQGGGSLSVGTFPPAPAASESRIRELAALFEATPVKFNDEDNIVLKRWYKLLWNVPFNTLAVLAGCIDTQTLIQDQYLANLAERMMREVVAVANATGNPLAGSDIQQNMEYTRSFPPYKPSMLLDYEAHRPMEVEAILGNVIRIADRVKIEVPQLKTVYAILRMIDVQNVKKGSRK